jgi:hypothetical protein
MNSLTRTLFITAILASTYCQVTESIEYIPELTENGKLKFSMHNLNPKNIYRALTQGIKENVTLDPKKNCDDFDSKAKTCRACKEGYFLVFSGKKAGTCSTCSSSISNCFSCSSSLDAKKAITVVQCLSCNFPKMPNKKLDTCVNRKVLLYYFIVYCAVAVVLALLTCIEKPPQQLG